MIGTGAHMGKTVKHVSCMKRSDATIGYGTIRTRGPFHRLFPCFHVAARVPPTRLAAYTEKLAMRDGSLCTYTRTPSLPLSSLLVSARLHACVSTMLGGSWKVRCIFNTRHASMPVEIGPIIRRGREFTTKEAEPPPPAFHVI